MKTPFDRLPGSRQLLHFVIISLSMLLVSRWNAETRAAFSTAEYFHPLVPASTWTYRISGGSSGTVVRSVPAATKVFHGVSASGLRDVRNGELEAVRWWSTGKGLQLHRWDLNEKTNPAGFMFQQALDYLPASIDLNGFYPYTGAGALIPEDGSQPTAYPGAIEGSMEVLGTETVTVPAGRYDCLKIALTELWNLNGEIIQASIEIWWLAKGVGVVKLAQNDPGIWELTAYSPGNVPGTPPAILTEPQDLAVKAGDSALFSITATGPEPLSFQWLKNTLTCLKGSSCPNPSN